LEILFINLDDAIGLLFIPNFPPNVLGIYPFEIPSNAQIASDMSRSELHRFLGSVPDDVSIRCVIFFFVQRQSYAVDCIKKLLEYYPSQIAIIGGFVDKINYDDRQIHPTQTVYDACGIVITGDQNHLHIGEILLENHIRTREQIREKLNELKYLETNSYLSFAIQISCIARGSNYYNDEQNVECSEFRKLFPNTPLIGVFGNGELGHDYLPNCNQTTAKQQSGRNLFRGYSSVFTLISLHK
jgi:F-box protein 22